MPLTTIGRCLWGQRARLSYLFIASLILLMTMLGARDVWTQEHRWADIVAGMFFRHDFIHPYLGENNYYDKPLLSYWLIALIAKLSGGLTTWALRFPSACAGLLAIGSIYRLGYRLKDRQFGLLSAWLLLTTYFFIFWARTSSADMLNLAGSLLAVCWYFEKKDQGSFFNYFIFFLILALTCLCKGLVGGIVPIIAIFTDMVLHKSIKSHLRLSLFFAILAASSIYLLPFLVSNYYSNGFYNQNGLYLVYKENILRYFQPFDHQGPIYTYLVYLPIYLLPWAIFLPSAMLAIKKRLPVLSINSKWIMITLLLLFLFFTASGSRRSYYVLPMVPFAILFIADWLLSERVHVANRWLPIMVMSSFICLFTFLDLLPAWYYSRVGMNRFADTLKAQAVQIKPWNTWDVVMLDAESKLNFYLQLPPYTKQYKIKGEQRKLQNRAALLQSWPILANKPNNTIFISRKLYQPSLEGFFSDYEVVELPMVSIPFFNKQDVNAPIAFIPKRKML